MPEVKFPRPKVMLIDLPESDAELLRQAGYNVTEGSLGPRTGTVVADKYGYVPLKGKLPNRTEQEIVVADLEDPDPKPATPEEPPPGEPAVWQKLSGGVIDSRPYVAHYIQDDFDRIHKHGGIFVFFLDYPSAPDYVWAEQGYSGLQIDRELHWTCWDLLTELSYVERKSDFGQEIDVAESSNPRLTRHLKEATFSVAIDSSYSQQKEDRWLVLARSKFGETVAALIGPEKDVTEGWVFLFPRIPRKGELVKELLETLFPNLRPELFPHAERLTWIDRPEYQLPQVRELQAQVQKVEQEADEQIRALRDQISLEREKFGYLQRILTETGDELVEAVIETLNALGFADVRDVDKEEAEESAEATGDSNGGGEEKRKREDIQIHDQSPVILAEVKGIAALPKEAGSLQVWKYIAPRMRQWERTDVRGLSIVNHQRHIPPLDRERKNVFQADVVANAEDQQFGLLTTFDLYRLARGYFQHGWRHEDVEALFYENGRIEPIPRHYEQIGVIDGFWERAEAVGIQLETELKVGETLAFELPLEFVEEQVGSIQLDDQAVEKGEAGQHIGLKTKLTKDQARNKVRVFRVKPGSGTESG